MTDAAIVCWNCHALVGAEQSECPECKAGLRPFRIDDEEATARFVDEQRVLRAQLGLDAADVTLRSSAVMWDHDRVKQPPGTVVIQAKHASGLGLAPKTNVSLWFADDQVYFIVKDGGSTALWVDSPPVRSIVSEATQVGYVSIESAGTKSNVGAIALFGIFALGARRDWSAVSVDLAGSEAVVLVREPVYTLRETMRLATRQCPSLEGRVVEGPPPLAQPSATVIEPVVAESDKLAGVERLAALYEKDLIDDEEFAALKSSLIRGE